jgi:hypothetical protein
VKITKKNYLKLDIPAAENHLNAKYINDISIKRKDGEWANNAVALFYSENPDKSKGHKHYVYLFHNLADDNLYVGGADELDDETRFISAILCDKCDELIYSAYRHDYTECSCGKTFIDGGRDYSRYSPGKLLKFDLFENKVVEELDK